MSVRRPFYEGETIDLLVPTREDVEDSSWVDWFNSQRTNRYTQHALFPNTVEKQREFYESLQNNSRLSLLISTKQERQIIGTISLSGIDFRRRCAAIAVVMDTETQHGGSPFASLEAMALVTQHGFEALGLSRINAGQVYPALAKWNQFLEILGYRAEGFRRQAFRRGHIVSDEVTLACLYSNYAELVAAREGALWPGVDRIRALIRELPKKPFAQLLDESQRALEASYFGDAANSGDDAATRP